MRALFIVALILASTPLSSYSSAQEPSSSPQTDDVSAESSAGVQSGADVQSSAGVEVAGGETASGYTFDDVVNGLKQQESRVKTLGLVANVRREIQTSFFSGPSLMRNTFVDQWHVDPDVHGWTKAKGRSTNTKDDNRADTEEFEHHATFDGALGKCLSKTARNGREPSLNGSIQKVLVRDGVSPFDFTFCHQGKLIGDSLSKNGGQIVREEKWKGRTVLVVESTPVINARQFKSQYWVDPERDFTVVRRRTLNRATDEEEWHVYYAVESLQHKKHESGVWLPQLALKRSFDRPTKKFPDGRVNASYNIQCTEWTVNEPIDFAEMQIEFPPGLKIHGMGELAEPAEKSQRFFVVPIESELQRDLLGERRAIAYASVDVTAIMDVNTRVIDLQKVDFAELKRQLKQACGDAKEPALYLSLDYGSLETDNIAEAFVSEPLRLIAKRAGFKTVRLSSHHGGNGVWKPLNAKTADVNDVADNDAAVSSERNLGDADWDVYEVTTPLSRRFAGGFDFVIRAKNRLPLPPTSLLDNELASGIATALSDRNIQGKSVDIKLLVGGARDQADEDAAFRKQGAALQLEVVDALRELGFGEIRLTIKVGWSNFPSRYNQ